MVLQSTEQLIGKFGTTLAQLCCVPHGDGGEIPPTSSTIWIGSCAGSRFSSVKPGQGGRADLLDAKFIIYEDTECCGKAESYGQCVDFTESVDI